MRVTVQNRNFTGRNLTGQDYTNGYAYRCNFTDARMGVLVNATFIECNLTNADFSKSPMVGIELQDCITTGMKFCTDAAYNALPLTVRNTWPYRAFVPLHDHECMAELIRQIPATGTLKTRLDMIAAAVRVGRLQSYENLATDLKQPGKPVAVGLKAMGFVTLANHLEAFLDR